MRIYDQTNRELMQVASIEASGNELLIRGRIFGAMPIVAKLRPEEARAAFRLVGFRTWLFLLTLPFRAAVGTRT
jgi:hypothetical protein